MGSVRSQRFGSVLIVAVFVLAFTLGATAQANPSAPGSTAPEGSAPHAQTLPGNGNAAPPDATTQEPAGQEPAGQQNATQEPASNDSGRFVVLQATVVDERRHLVPTSAANTPLRTSPPQSEYETGIPIGQGRGARPRIRAPYSPHSERILRRRNRPLTASRRQHRRTTRLDCPWGES